MTVSAAELSGSQASWLQLQIKLSIRIPDPYLKLIDRDLQPNASGSPGPARGDLIRQLTAIRQGRCLRSLELPFIGAGCISSGAIAARLAPTSESARSLGLLDEEKVFIASGKAMVLVEA